jgi:MraZ protein
MFLSQYRHSIDSKGRLTIPADYREKVSNGAYVTQGFDGNLRVLTTASFDFIYNQVSQMSVTNPAVRQLSRLLFSTAAQVHLDKNGRILIPQFLRDTAGLGNEAVIVGSGIYFEIWSPERWQDQVEQMADVEFNIDQFSSLNLRSGQ